MVDAVWMKAWVDFAMEKGDPPGPISNYNLYLDVSELPLKRQQCTRKYSSLHAMHPVISCSMVFSSPDDIYGIVVRGTYD